MSGHRAGHGARTFGATPGRHRAFRQLRTAGLTTRAVSRDLRAVTRNDALDTLRGALARHERLVLPDLREDVVRVATAVLVPLRFDGEVHILLTMRGGALRHHAGEMSFPGGKPEASDGSLLVTALREAEEEIGIARAEVDVLGELSAIPTATSHYILHPFVGMLRGSLPTLAPSDEVARVVEIPIRALADGRVKYRQVPFTWAGREIVAPVFELSDGTVIYGATAYILMEALGVIGPALGIVMPTPTIRAPG